MSTLPLFKDISDIDFIQEVEKAPGIVVLVFYRSSCSSCKTFEPVLEQLTSLYKDQVKFTRLNTDVGGTFHAKRLRTAGDPTTFVFYNGKVEGSFVGASHAKYFLPIMADIFTSLAGRVGIPAPTAVVEPATQTSASPVQN